MSYSVSSSGPRLYFLLGIAFLLGFGLSAGISVHTYKSTNSAARRVYIPEHQKADAAKLYAEVYKATPRGGPANPSPEEAAQDAVERIYGQ